MSHNLLFSIQTLNVMPGGALKGIEPDQSGVYRAVPVAVIGKPSRNNVLYDPNSFVNAMTDTRSRFYKNLTEGNLEGEWGHPLQSSNPKEAIQRTLTIDRTKVSHYFSRINTENSACGKYIVVYADIVPNGPYGEFLKESFSDPKRNTSFSLRSLTSAPRAIGGGISSKAIVAMVTFDAVDGPGFEEASKRYMVGNEGFNFQTEDKKRNFKFDTDDEVAAEMTVQEIVQFPEFAKVVGFENIQCQEILDRLESEKVTITREVIIEGIYDEAQKAIITPDGKASVFHSLHL
jgi:hypothetical protein